MNNDTNYCIRHYFHDLFHAQKQVAQCQASSSIELLNLPRLAPPERVRQIVQELDLLHQKMDVFERKEYLDFADDEPHLFNYFSGHLYFCRHDEEQKLLEGLVLNQTHHLLSELLLEAMAQMPLFPLAAFMNNDPNVVFYELNQQPFGTSDEDYAAMRYWQTRMKIECVDLESNLLVARFIESVKGLPCPLDHARAEKDQVEFLQGNATHISVGEFITKFSHLRALSPGAMPDNAAQWHESFCQFIQGTAMPYALSPGSLELALSNIRAGKISSAPFCVWSLMTYTKWLGDALQGKVDLNTIPEHSYEKLFEKNWTVAPLKSKVIISEYNQKINPKP